MENDSITKAITLLAESKIDFNLRGDVMTIPNFNYKEPLFAKIKAIPRTELKGYINERRESGLTITFR